MDRQQWFARFIEAVQKDNRSMRDISRAAGCGPNYVQQMIRNGKEPGADRLARLLDVLDGPTALYVLTGIKASQDDLEILRFIQQMPPAVKGQTRALLAALQARDEC